MRGQRILVCLPAVGFRLSAKLPSLWKPPFLGVGRFKPTFRSLEFSKELDIKPVGKSWSVGVPGWDLEKRGFNGVAGPGGKPLFFPTNAARKLAQACGVYDEWRPYPAEKPLSNYAREMAIRIAKKRARVTKLITSSFPWDFIVVSDHSAASVAHVDDDAAAAASNIAIDAATSIISDWPDAILVIVGPYGVGTEDGFVVSNRMESSVIEKWDQIRKYANGERLNPVGNKPA